MTNLQQGIEERGYAVLPGLFTAERVARLVSELKAIVRPIRMGARAVLLIRPLAVHRSGPSRPGTSRHRRTLRFEFAPEQALPAGLAWQRFLDMTP